MSCAAHGLAASRGMLVLEDVDLIRELVSQLPEEPLIVELGAGSGTTAAAVLAERPEAELWTIDISLESLMWARQFLINNHLGNHWQPYQSDSVEAAKVFEEGGPIDMLLIDSSHEYDHTVAELAVWVPLVKSGGFVWCHDYKSAIGVIPGANEEYPGVRQAVQEVVLRGELKPIKVHGLGVALEKP